jgi:hypothetical protein
MYDKTWFEWNEMVRHTWWMWMNFESHQCESFVNQQLWKLFMKIPNSPCMMRTDRKGGRGKNRTVKLCSAAYSTGTGNRLACRTSRFTYCWQRTMTSEAQPSGRSMWPKPTCVGSSGFQSPGGSTNQTCLCLTTAYWITLPYKFQYYKMRSRVQLVRWVTRF